MLNNTLLEFIKKEAACLTGADRAKAIKVSAMARRAWKETDDNTLKEALLTYANANKKEYVNGSVFTMADMDAAKAMYEDLLANVSDIDTTVPLNALNVLPFYIEAETNIGKKEHYQDVSVRFNAAVEKLDTTNVSDTVTLMLALVSAYELMSEQIFEYYMAVATNYKKLLKEMLPRLENASSEDRMIAAYTIVRAADMKIILAEKYECLSDDLLR